MRSTDEQELWQAYRQDGDPGARERLLERHLPLVHHVARRLQRTTRTDAEYEDLVGSGTVGLIEAVESFDVSRGLAFSTHAAPRIRGAILDERRRRDPLSRTRRSRQREVRRVEEELASSLLRRPREDETAQALGVPVSELSTWRVEERVAVPISLDGPGEGESGDGLPPSEVVADPFAEDPEARLEAEEEVRRVRDAVMELPEQERVVVSLYHFEELTLRQIGEVLGVTESRVSQIRTRALGRLRERLSAAGEGRAA